MAHLHLHAHALEREASRRALTVALALTAAFTVVEVVGGLLTGSLALLADAVHMLSDNVAIALALVALWLAGRPSTPQRTFGYQRAEVLVALGNGVALVALAAWIFYAALRRLDDPPEVLGGWMLAIAALGVAVNVVAAGVLHRAPGGINVEAAFRHVLADLLGSLGVVAAAVVILATGRLEADPIAGMLIAVLVVASAWSIVRDSTRILLEAAPSGLDTRAVGERLAAVSGVVEVHDLHIWTITSGFPALSAHVLVGRGEDCHALRRELESVLRGEFGIEHSTLQVDHVGESEGLLEIGRIERR